MSFLSKLFGKKPDEVSELAGYDYGPGQYGGEEEVKGCAFERKGWDGQGGAYVCVSAESIPGS